MDVTYSKLQGWLAADEAGRILRVVRGRLGLPVFHPLLASRRGGRTAWHPGRPGRVPRTSGRQELTVLMLRGIGNPVDVHEMDEAVVAEAISELARLTPRC